MSNNINTIIIPAIMATAIIKSTSMLASSVKRQAFVFRAVRNAHETFLLGAVVLA